MKSRAVPFTKGNFLLSFLSLAGGQDVTCGPGKTKEKVTLGEGDSSTFHTQAQYGPGVNCKVTYKRKRKAKCDLSFSCEEFEVRRAEGLPGERHQGCRHLHRACQEEDRHSHGRGVRPEASGTHPVRLWWLK